MLEIEVYYSGSKIVFGIQFPIVYPETFSYYHLYSIQNQNSIILPKDSYLIVNENHSQNTSLPCTNLHPGFYYHNDNIVDGLLHEQDCIFQLLQLQSTPRNWHTVPILLKHDITQQIDESHDIVIIPNQTKEHLQCGRTEFTLLLGNYLINLSYQCSFWTKN